MDSEMSEHTESQPDLPIGATVLERAPVEHSKEIARELADLGGSDALIAAVGGPEILEELRAERAELSSNGGAGVQNADHPS